MERVTITMPEDTRLTVKRMAEREGLSFSAMMVELLRAALIRRGLLTESTVDPEPLPSPESRKRLQP